MFVKTLESLEDVKAFIADNDIAIIGFFKDGPSEASSPDGMDDYPFSKTEIDAVAEEYTSSILGIANG